MYGFVYLGFAYLNSTVSLILLFVAYGAYSAFISGAERAFVAEKSPLHLKGMILGLYGTIQGIGLFLSSMIAGLLWNQINSSAPFVFGGLMGLLSALLVFMLNRYYQRKSLIL